MSSKTFPEVRRSTRPYNDRRRELAWLAAHEEEYAGQWVLLEGERLVAHGDDPLSFREIARAERIEVPFIVHCRTWFGPAMGGWL
ncbi:MAG TPA: DUF5678 domain-containing protein [Blastocatellia bacterium]|nr:DUF5678 domain-containing protein [Blastocatellia bacterium]